MLLTISLHNLHFFAYHGLYEEEKILGNHFELNVVVKHAPPELPVKRLDDTIDYVAVYELVRRRMEIPTPLLETVVTEIAKEILIRFTLAEEVFISIRKMYPPISYMHARGSVGVGFELKRKDL
ncbi:dihydroneopterin aldolase [Sediminibacterium roseum]|uniref:dihydroneopterin aldolase n=1 Tax=Sediminibacterium roseum TaxID=1978412 RepID=UPI00137959DA|nr:dihydroneopterin aldolase [Sediminibacterium roseum]